MVRNTRAYIAACALCAVCAPGKSSHRSPEPIVYPLSHLSHPGLFFLFAPVFSSVGTPFVTLLVFVSVGKLAFWFLSECPCLLCIWIIACISPFVTDGGMQVVNTGLCPFKRNPSVKTFNPKQAKYEEMLDNKICCIDLQMEWIGHSRV